VLLLLLFFVLLLVLLFWLLLFIIVIVILLFCLLLLLCCYYCYCCWCCCYCCCCCCCFYCCYCYVHIALHHCTLALHAGSHDRPFFTHLHTVVRLPGCTVYAYTHLPHTPHAHTHTLPPYPTHLQYCHIHHPLVTLPAHRLYTHTTLVGSGYFHTGLHGCLCHTVLRATRLVGLSYHRTHTPRTATGFYHCTVYRAHHGWILVLCLCYVHTGYVCSSHHAVLWFYLYTHTVYSSHTLPLVGLPHILYLLDLALLHTTQQFFTHRTLITLHTTHTHIHTLVGWLLGLTHILDTHIHALATHTPFWLLHHWLVAVCVHLGYGCMHTLLPHTTPTWVWLYRRLWHGYATFCLYFHRVGSRTLGCAHCTRHGCLPHRTPPRGCTAHIHVWLRTVYFAGSYGLPAYAGLCVRFTHIRTHTRTVYWFYGSHLWFGYTRFAHGSRARLHGSLPTTYAVHAHARTAAACRAAHPAALTAAAPHHCIPFALHLPACRCGSYIAGSRTLPWFYVFAVHAARTAHACRFVRTRVRILLRAVRLRCCYVGVVTVIMIAGDCDLLLILIVTLLLIARFVGGVDLHLVGDLDK